MPERFRPYEKVDEFSDAYQESRYSVEAQGGVVQDEMFGASALAAHEVRFKHKKASPESPSKFPLALREARAHLLSLLESDEDFVLAFLGETVNSSEMEERAFADPHGFLERLSYDGWITILGRHREAFEARVAYVRERVGEMRELLIVQVMDLFSRLDITAAEAEVRQRLETVSILFVDPIADEDPEVRVTYDPDENTVRLHTDLNETWLHVQFNHEMLHALSGRTIEHDLDGDEDDDEPQFHHSRMGMHLLRGERGEDTFVWLDEAITEYLATIISFGDQDQDPCDPSTIDLHLRHAFSEYRPERELLKLMLTRGKSRIDFAPLLRAYFENYNPSDLKGERMKSWREVVLQVNVAYEPRFLRDLDVYVARNGVEAAVLAMSEGPGKIVR